MRASSWAPSFPASTMILRNLTSPTTVIECGRHALK